MLSDLIAIGTSAVIMSGVMVLLIRLAGGSEISRNALKVFLCHLVLALAVISLFVFFFHYVAPDRVLSTDGVRYLHEMRLISRAPFEWNIFTGDGPNYSQTAKMGYSWLVGFLMWCVGSDSVAIAMIFNVSCALSTAALAFFATQQLSRDLRISLLAFWLMIFFPEIQYWTPRVTREPLSLFLVAMLGLLSVRALLYFTVGRVVRLLVVGSGVSILLMLTRAQLALFFPLTFILLLLSLLLYKFRNLSWLSLSVATCSALIILFWALPLFTAQIRSVVGSDVLRILQPEQIFGSITHSGDKLRQVLTPIARQEHGALGFLLFPIFFLSLLASYRGLKQLFLDKKVKAVGLFLILVSFLYVLSLSVTGAINIRFRIYAWLFLMPLIAYGVFSLFQYFKLLHLWWCMIFFVGSKRSLRPRRKLPRQVDSS